MKSSDFQSGQQRTMLVIAGIIVLAFIGIGLLVVGFAWSNRGQSSDQPSPTPTAALPSTPAGGAVVPTLAPLPTATPPLPTDTPTATPLPEPMIVAQEGGANLRSGPGTNFSVVSRLEGGESVRVIGKYTDWWQVDNKGTPAWVASWVVTGSNVEGVADVVPPASPIPPTAVPPTKVPPTATSIPPTPVPDTRGVRADRFDVGTKDLKVKAPGPFGNAGDIWFYMKITNTGNGEVTITKWGAYVQETGDFQKSWGGSGGGEPLKLGLNGVKEWDDHINQFTLSAGKFHLWMRVCFNDGYCVNLAGPVLVEIG